MRIGGIIRLYCSPTDSLDSGSTLSNSGFPWFFSFVDFEAGVGVFTAVRRGEKKQIPCRDDRKKGKSKSGFFAALRMTRLRDWEIDKVGGGPGLIAV
jgi:hypothetical protein